MYFRLVCTLAYLLLGLSFGTAQSTVSFMPPSDETDNFQTEVLLSDLDNPTGLAVGPTEAKRGPYDLFFAESGAGRVLRVSTDDFEQADDVITGVPTGSLGEEPEYRVSATGLRFLSRNRLLVAVAASAAESAHVSCFSLPTGGTVLTDDQADYSIEPASGKGDSADEQLRPFGIAMVDELCFVTVGAQEPSGRVFKASLEANRLVDLRLFVEETEFGVPTGISVIPEPRPGFLVVASMGSRDAAQDSRLAYIVPATGEVVLNLATGLNDVVSLAYSPSGQLYVADFSWTDPQAGGVYRIDDARIDDRQGCQAVKIASIVRPFGLAFAPDGSLYVTAFDEGENSRQGKLIKITGEL